MRIPKTPRQNVDQETDLFYRLIAQQINDLSEGRRVALYHARQSSPTTGAYANGDFVPNSNVSELGTAGNKYVIDGWQCVVAGDPATFVQRRFLTGN
jgi:hypothetical protein